MSTIESRDNGIYVCPIGRDGKFIRPGETLYGNDGKAWMIRAVGPTYCYADEAEAGRSVRLRGEWLTHERPDSWERLLADLRRARDLGAYGNCAYFGFSGTCGKGCPARGTNAVCSQAVYADVIGRISRLREADHD